MTIELIPLSRLAASPSNVRKTGGAIAIDELAASIAAHGLLQNLQVRKTTKDKYEVIAGGRRLKALQLLAKGKIIAKSFAVPCNILGDEDVTEISLAENIVREPMHPADQFDAFQEMVANGRGVEEIAARFGCAASTVKQRLKLATVSPFLMQAYRDGEMTLDQLMAFTVSDDPRAQDECWHSLPYWNQQPEIIRRTLMAAHVRADDARVAFVGLDTYAAAGGPMVRDLFQPEHEGYLADAALLDRLVAERLECEAETVRADGWLWVEIVLAFDHQTLQPFDQLEAAQLPLSSEESEELERLSGEYDALADEAEANEDDTQLAAISERIDALTDGKRVWTDDQKAVAGAVVGIDYSGELAIRCGLVRSSERTAARKQFGSEDEAHTSEPVAKPTGLSAKLVEELTAQRTAALQILLAEKPEIALAALTETLVRPLFYGSHTETSLAVRTTEHDMQRYGKGLTGSKAVGAFDALVANWTEQLPKHVDDLPGWLQKQPAATVVALLAVCTAASLNAVQGANDGPSIPRLAHGNGLAQTLGLDMAQWWQPTGTAYLARVPKARVLEAVAEAKSRQVSDNLADLKKDALVAQAEGLLAGSGWLPEILRTPG